MIGNHESYKDTKYKPTVQLYENHSETDGEASTQTHLDTEREWHSPAWSTSSELEDVNLFQDFSHYGTSSLLHFRAIPIAREEYAVEQGPRLGELFTELNQLKEKIQRLEEEQKRSLKYRFDIISDKEAEKRIIEHLRNLKKSKQTASVFETSQDLSIPANQVETVFEKLAEKGKVSFRDGE